MMDPQPKTKVDEVAIGTRLWIIDKGLGTGGLYDGGAFSVNVYDPLVVGVATTTQPAHIFSRFIPMLIRSPSCCATRLKKLLLFNIATQYSSSLPMILSLFDS